MTFTWNDTGASQYWMWVGTSAGNNDVYNRDQGTNTSVDISGLPHSGETLYARLWSKVNGEWLYNSDYTYTACNQSSSIAGIQSPTSGSVLGSTSETFTWNNAGASQYWLRIGTSAGSNDVYNGNQETNTSAVISGLPSSGQTLYVRLWSKVSGTWFYDSDSTYTAVGQDITEILSQAAYDELFPNRNSLYGYDALVEASRSWPLFVNEGTLEQRKRELAAFLANISHETTGGWPTAPGGSMHGDFILPRKWDVKPAHVRGTATHQM